MTNPQDVVAAARKYLGVAYHSKGRSKSEIDCIGLLICTAQDLGIDHGFDFVNYTDWPDGIVLFREMRKVLEMDAKPTIAPGKIALFYMPGIQRKMHVGIFAENNVVIDPSMNEGRVVEFTFNPKRYFMKLAHTFDYPEVAEWRRVYG